MKPETVRQLIDFLEAMAHHSHQTALKFAALDRVARKNPTVFAEYKDFLGELRDSETMQEGYDRTQSALAKLRSELLRDRD